MIMQAQKANWVQYSTLIVMAMLALGMMFNVGNLMRVQEKQDFPDLTIPTAEDIAKAIVVPVTDNDKIDGIYDEIFEEDMIKDYVRGMISEETDSKDFARALLEVLNTELAGDFEVDHYRDITKVVLKDIKDDEIALFGEDATVEFEVKVYYFVDDDKDETGKALVSVELELEDLNVEDEFEDAEIVEYDEVEFNFEKFYTEDYR